MVIDKIKKREMPESDVKPEAKSKVDIPVGKWIKCDKCKEILYKENVHKNFGVCPNCGNHFRL